MSIKANYYCLSEMQESYVYKYLLIYLTFVIRIVVSIRNNI